MEYFWRASQQIVMLTPNEPAEKADIEGWGSGFSCNIESVLSLLLATTIFICLMIMQMEKELDWTLALL